MTPPHTDPETLTSAVMTYGCLNGRMVYLNYDCRNRLTCVKDQNGTIITRYEYDAENVRTAVIEGSSRTVYVTDREAPYSQILTATAYKEGILATGKPTAQTLYTYGLGLISEHRTPQGSEEETYYYHYNHLGSTTAVTDNQGTITYRFTYDTYGELTDIRDADYHSLKNIAENEGYTKEQLAQAIGITFLYNGQYGVQTDANGLYYMRARYYSQDIKRFINRDVVTGTITNSQSLNRYSYVQGNPVKLTDPFGLCPDSNSAFKNLCKAAYHFDWAGAGHGGVSLASCVWIPLSFVNAVWYAKEGNTKAAITSALIGVFGVGTQVGVALMCNPTTAGVGAAVTAVSIFGLGCIGLACGGEMFATGLNNLIAGLKNGEVDNKAIAQMVFGGFGATLSLYGMGYGLSQTFAMYNKTMMSAAADSATKAGIEGANASLKSSVEKAQMQGISGQGGSNANQTLLSGKEWYRYFQDTYGADNVNWNVSSFDDMLNHPTSLRGYSADEIGQILGDGWTRSTYGSNGSGWKFIENAHPDNMVFYHGGGGKHNGAYYGISIGGKNGGRVKVVDINTYIPYSNDDATIIYNKDW